jgi:HD superfamily phosphohydrolase
MSEFPLEIRDPVYGFIPFDDWERQIIDSFPFQRLRRIQQLALTSFIYPGAVHSRFEHSLGVMHLATLMFNNIISRESNMNLLKDILGYREIGIEKTRRLIRLAALLHDIGHAPFSHAGEEIMPVNSQTGKKYKHENYTSAIIRNALKSCIEDHKINKANYKITADDVANLIDGLSTDFLFWKVLISSQLDADKGDYLLRDSHHIGVKYGVYDYNRLLNTLALGIDPETKNDIILGVREDGWHVAESVILARYQMFTQVYFHKTRRAFDYHLLNAFKKILKNEVLPDTNHLDEYLDIDDYVIWEHIKKNKLDKDFRALLYREQVRAIYSTKEMKSNDSQKNIEKKSAILNDHKIPFIVDELNSLWYKSKIDLEIMVIDKENNPSPLSKYSPIVQNIGEIGQSRIYVDKVNQEKGKEFIDDK